jgi:hypothetical protein
VAAGTGSSAGENAIVCGSLLVRETRKSQVLLGVQSVSWGDPGAGVSRWRGDGRRETPSGWMTNDGGKGEQGNDGKEDTAGLSS